MLYKNKMWLEEQVKLGKSITDIAKETNVNFGTIKYWEKKLNVNIPRHYGAKRKNCFNLNFFSNIDNEDKAYILGFIMADGWINSNNRSLHIRIKADDAELLKKISEVLNNSTPLKSKKNGTQVELILCSEKLVKDLNKLGVTYNKTKTMHMPLLKSKELYRHFFRGYFDGDGYIGKQSVLTVGSENFYNDFMKYLKREFDFVPWSQCKNGTYRINFNRRDFWFIDWLYKNSNLHLNRKFKSYLNNMPNKKE